MISVERFFTRCKYKLINKRVNRLYMSVNFFYGEISSKHLTVIAIIVKLWYNTDIKLTGDKAYD